MWPRADHVQNEEEAGPQITVAVCMVHTGRGTLLRFTTSQISLALTGYLQSDEPIYNLTLFSIHSHTLSAVLLWSPFPNMIISHNTADYRGAHSRRLCVQPPAPVTLSSRWKLTELYDFSCLISCTTQQGHRVKHDTSFTKCSKITFPPCTVVDFYKNVESCAFTCALEYNYTSILYIMATKQGFRQQVARLHGCQSQQSVGLRVKWMCTSEVSESC